MQITHSYRVPKADADALAKDHKAIAMPSAHEIKSLFRAYLRLGRTFPNYNMRQ